MYNSSPSTLAFTLLLSFFWFPFSNNRELSYVMSFEQHLHPDVAIQIAIIIKLKYVAGTHKPSLFPPSPSFCIPKPHQLIKIGESSRAEKNAVQRREIASIKFPAILK